MAVQLNSSKVSLGMSCPKFMNLIYRYSLVSRISASLSVITQMNKLKFKQQPSKP